MDLDKDGNLDLIANTYMSGVFIFKGLGEGKYDEAKSLTLANGKTLKDNLGCPIAFDDVDNDGDYDFIIGGVIRPESLTLFINEGSYNKPSYKTKGILLKTKSGKNIRNVFSFKYYDWDSDGKKDIIQCDQASIILYRNISTKEVVLFEDAKYLFGRKLSTKEILAEYNKNKGKTTELAHESTMPSGKTQISIFDYNRDGKVDVILGDAFRQITNTTRIHSLEEKNRIKELKAEIKGLNKKIDALKAKLKPELGKPYPKEIQELVSKVFPLEMEYEQLIFDTNKFGRVWVYIRK